MGWACSADFYVLFLKSGVGDAISLERRGIKCAAKPAIAAVRVLLSLHGRLIQHVESVEFGAQHKRFTSKTNASKGFAPCVSGGAKLTKIGENSKRTIHRFA